MIKNSFVKNIKNDIYLSDDDINVLKKYEIEYLNYSSMKELMFLLEDIINNNYVDSDLEELLIKLSEYNYYFRTNK